MTFTRAQSATIDRVEYAENWLNVALDADDANQTKVALTELESAQKEMEKLGVEWNPSTEEWEQT